METAPGHETSLDVRLLGRRWMCGLVQSAAETSRHGKRERARAVPNGSPKAANPTAAVLERVEGA